MDPRISPGQQLGLGIMARTMGAFQFCCTTEQWAERRMAFLKFRSEMSCVYVYKHGFANEGIRIDGELDNKNEISYLSEQILTCLPYNVSSMDITFNSTCNVGTCPF